MHVGVLIWLLDPIYVPLCFRDLTRLRLLVLVSRVLLLLDLLEMFAALGDGSMTSSYSSVGKTNCGCEPDGSGGAPLLPFELCIVKRLVARQSLCVGRGWALPVPFW